MTKNQKSAQSTLRTLGHELALREMLDVGERPSTKELQSRHEELLRRVYNIKIYRK